MNQCALEGFDPQDQVQPHKTSECGHGWSPLLTLRVRKLHLLDGHREGLIESDTTSVGVCQQRQHRLALGRPSLPLISRETRFRELGGLHPLMKSR